MGFPAPSVVAPSLSTFQWSFGGLTVGQGEGVSGWGVQTVDGLGMVAFRTGDASRPVDQGEFAGKDQLAGRDITLKLLRFGGTSYQLGWATDQLIRAYLATVPSDGETEVPIWTNRPYFGLMAAMVRGRQEGQSSSRLFAHMKTSQPVLPFHATDPRFYGPTVTTILNAPSFASGFSFPFHANAFSFGGGSAVAQATINNTGQFEMRPVIKVTGPGSVPAIANASIAGVPTIAFNVTLNFGDQLIIDLDAQSALLVTYGTTVGVTRLGTFVPGSTWWNLPPGPNVIQFGIANSTTAKCEIDWAPAYGSLI